MGDEAVGGSAGAGEESEGILMPKDKARKPPAELDIRKIKIVPPEVAKVLAVWVPPRDVVSSDVGGK